MGGYSAEVAAERSGASTEEIAHLTELGILNGTDGYSDADIRRVQVVQAIERAGLGADDMARLLEGGNFSLDFIDAAGANVFAALSDRTFAELSAQTGIPVEQLTVLRDVTGGKTARPDDRVREDELEIMPLIQFQLELGFSWQAIERALRVYGDSLRRAAEGEAEWWRSEVQAPILARGGPAGEIGRIAAEVSPRLSEASDRAVMAIYHAQQMHVWSVNIVNGISIALEQAGLHEHAVVEPAICFLDLTGYTQLTQQQGDAAAVELVARLSRIVQPISVEHGGRPIKWLGDGVMFHFPDPGPGVVAALAMIEALAAAGLPAAHVGLDAGPIVIQEGDFYGQTVNLAARIGEYARPGEVLVSRAVLEVARGTALTFEPIGSVGLKGVSGLVDLYVARRST